MRINKKLTDANEEKVAYLLEKVLGGEWKVNKDRFSIYDISGVDRDGNKTIVEVKLRTKLRPKLWLNEEKVFSIGNKYTELGADKAILVCSFDEDHYVYDFKRLVDFPVIERMMTQVTSEDGIGYGKPSKINRVYEFPWSSYMFNLTTGELGVDYERV